jgi:fermentation-respiration switch protein FrsA (DUF1100 family)
MKILALIIAVPFFLFFSTRFLEHNSLYFPYRTIDATPKDIGLEYEEIELRTSDNVSLSAWFIPSERSRAVVLFCHGNGGNISHRLEKILIMNRLGLDTLIFDYRGYGRSTGKPSEKGLYIDVETMYDHLVNEKKLPPEKIVGYGESLGGPVIIELASKRDMAGIIIEDAFTSVREMAKVHFPFIPASFLKSGYNTLDKIENIKIPKLIFHSVNDEIVPFEQGKRIFEAAPEPKEFVELQGGHNDAFIVSRDVYSSGIDRFVGILSEEPLQ